MLVIDNIYDIDMLRFWDWATILSYPCRREPWDIPSHREEDTVKSTEGFEDATFEAWHDIATNSSMCAHTPSSTLSLRVMAD